MSQELALAAMKKRVCLGLHYDGFSRLVEVHAVGVTRKGSTCMRVYQVAGGSASGNVTGWKLMTIENGTSFQVSDIPSQAPREGYARDDKAMATIFGQL